MYEICRGTAERICAKFTRKTYLVPRSDEFEDQGHRSRSPWTKAAFFGPFGGLRAVLFDKISLASGLLYLYNLDQLTFFEHKCQISEGKVWAARRCCGYFSFRWIVAVASSFLVLCVHAQRKTPFEISVYDLAFTSFNRPSIQGSAPRLRRDN